MPNIIRAPQVKFDSLAAFPAVGVINKLYVATDTDEIYIWDGAAYTSVSGGGGGGGLDPWTPTTLSPPVVVTVDGFNTDIDTTTNPNAHILSNTSQVGIQGANFFATAAEDFTNFDATERGFYVSPTIIENGNNGSGFFFAFSDGNPITGTPPATYAVGIRLANIGVDQWQFSSITGVDPATSAVFTDAEILNGNIAISISTDGTLMTVNVYLNGASGDSPVLTIIENGPSIGITNPLTVDVTYGVYAATAILADTEVLSIKDPSLSPFVEYDNITQYSDGISIDPASYPIGRSNGSYIITGLGVVVESELGDVHDGTVIIFDDTEAMSSRSVDSETINTTGDNEYSGENTFGGQTNLDEETYIEGIKLASISSNFTQIDESVDGFFTAVSGMKYIDESGAATSTIQMPNTSGTSFEIDVYKALRTGAAETDGYQLFTDGPNWYVNGVQTGSNMYIPVRGEYVKAVYSAGNSDWHITSFKAPEVVLGGTVGTTANAIPRADGTGGLTLKGSVATLSDTGTMTIDGANSGISATSGNDMQVIVPTSTNRFLVRDVLGGGGTDLIDLSTGGFNSHINGGASYLQLTTNTGFPIRLLAGGSGGDIQLQTDSDGEVVTTIQTDLMNGGTPSDLAVATKKYVDDNAGGFTNDSLVGYTANNGISLTTTGATNFSITTVQNTVISNSGQLKLTTTVGESEMQFYRENAGEESAGKIQSINNGLTLGDSGLNNTISASGSGIDITTVGSTDVTLTSATTGEVLLGLQTSAMNSGAPTDLCIATKKYVDDATAGSGNSIGDANSFVTVDTVGDNVTIAPDETQNSYIDFESSTGFNKCKFREGMTLNFHSTADSEIGRIQMSPTQFSVVTNTNVDLQLSAPANSEVKTSQQTSAMNSGSPSDLAVATKKFVEDNATGNGFSPMGAVDTNIPIDGAFNIIHSTVSDASASTYTFTTADITGTDRWECTIKDADGNCATNNFTIATQGSETIDGAATYVINTDFGAVTIYNDGVNLFIKQKMV